MKFNKKMSFNHFNPLFIKNYVQILRLSANILLTVMAQSASNRLKESVLQLSKLT